MFYRARPAAILLLCSLLGGTACEKLSPQQEHFQRGLNAYNKGDFSSALLYLKPLVEAGHPAAQLVMAKMYAHGDGVPRDMGKSELLRNLAALQIYRKKDLAPGVVRPDNETIATLSDRLDYTENTIEGKQEVPQDISKLLSGIDLKGMVDLPKMEGEPGVPSGVDIEIPRESGSAAPSETAPPADSMPEPSAKTPAPIPSRSSLVPPGESRRSAQITLTLVRQAAEKGDPMAMELLSAAYAHGYYGLTPSASQAMLWDVRAKEAQSQSKAAPEADPLEKAPRAQMWIIFGAGTVLIGVGAWRWRMTQKRLR